MGNTLVKCCVAGEGIVRVMTAEGDVEEFEWPISAGEVMEHHPGYLVLDTTGLERKEYKYGRYQVVPKRVRFMRSSMALQPGSLYVLYTVRTVPEKSIPLYVAAGLLYYLAPPEHQPVPFQPELSRSYTYSSSDSKKVSLGIRSSFPSQNPVEQFTPTCRSSRRSSMVIASDILHSFQVKEEAALEAPLFPDPKEEKPTGHGWSPSLFSIPESPAGSLRALESSMTTKQICKTPPRSSTNIHKLLKQAILHKDARSFWR